MLKYQFWGWMLSKICLERLTLSSRYFDKPAWGSTLYSENNTICKYIFYKFLGGIFKSLRIKLGTIFLIEKILLFFLRIKWIFTWKTKFFFIYFAYLYLQSFLLKSFFPFVELNFFPSYFHRCLFKGHRQVLVWLSTIKEKVNVVQAFAK